LCRCGIVLLKDRFPADQAARDTGHGLTAVRPGAGSSSEGIGTPEEREFGRPFQVDFVDPPWIHPVRKAFYSVSRMVS
ncbi:MAG TPA: hypothetical protein VIY86_08940, partial [Pirellulaceae bacterium]